MSKKCANKKKDSMHDNIIMGEQKRYSKNKSKNQIKQNQDSKYNISFVIGNKDNEEEQYSDFDEIDALYDETYEDSPSCSDDSSESEEEQPITNGNEETKINPYTRVKALFEKSLSESEQSNPTIKKMYEEIFKKEEDSLKRKSRKESKQKVKNTKKLKTMLKDENTMNDLKYFNENMDISQQEHALDQISQIRESSSISKPYRMRLLDADIPIGYKATAYRKISTLKYMDPGGSEYFKMKNWVDTFMQIPFGKYKNLSISYENNSVDECHDFMEKSKKILDDAVYGLDDAKLQILQMVGQWIVNPTAIGSSIAIKGPMGTGKTTLVKEGISKILGRDFAFVALGGATDSSFLEGHSYTYEGSTWGKIVDFLIKCKSMNPVIYFDELDKISDTPKGEEIAGILTHLTDTSQNSQFHDKYFSEIDFDLSRCLFIFSYNDESKVNRILLDRMYKIQTKGYDQSQKTTIASQYILPSICNQVKFNPSDITIPEATMHYIITNYTEKEDGVRTLKRCLEIIYTKLNLYRLMKSDTNIFNKEMKIKVTFPMEVTPEMVDKLVIKNADNGNWRSMYM